LALLDLGIVFAAYLVTLVIRLDGSVPPEYWANFWLFAPLAIVIHIFANGLFGLYGQMWRYASVLEARRVILAGLTAGGFVGAVAVLTQDELRPIPLSVPTFGAVLSVIGFGAVRFQSRLFGFRRRVAEMEQTRVLIVGAGDAGAMVLKDILANQALGLQPLGLIDDDPRKLGRSLHEVRILGTRSAIPALVERLDVEQILLAIPSATSEVVREVAAICEESDVTLRVLPALREIVGGRVTIKDIRELRIEDLLGREQVEVDLEAVSSLLAGRRVLVTGAGGSVGSEIVRQVASFGPSSLILLDHDETHLHDVLAELSESVPAEAALADIRDAERILRIFWKHRPEVVFHAAAHKHVPMLEEQPQEALLTNVVGTANVADAAVAARVGRLVLISTDKAVNPASVMGASKRFAEQLVLSLQDRECVFSAVRFGNVLGSRGSVIPTFFRQIAAGGPVTVTHPEMARYFMSVQEAVQLVLQASALSRGGEVFTLDMGEAVNIHELARRLIRLSGRVPGKDVRIDFVGPRPGEKLLEEIADPRDEPVQSAHPAIVVSRPPIPDRAALGRAIRDLKSLARTGPSEELVIRIKELAQLVSEPLVGGGRR